MGFTKEDNNRVDISIRLDFRGKKRVKVGVRWMWRREEIELGKLHSQEVKEIILNFYSFFSFKLLS